MKSKRLKIDNIGLGNILRHRNYKKFVFHTSGFYKVISINPKDKKIGVLSFEAELESLKFNYIPRPNIIKESTLTSNYMFINKKRTKLLDLLYGPFIK